MSIKTVRPPRPRRPAKAPVQQVGVRELKSELSGYLRRVTGGESLVVTDRGRPVARLVPPDMPEGIVRMIRDGSITWSGQKPDFTNFKPVRLKGPGKSISDYVIEERRD